MNQRLFLFIFPIFLLFFTQSAFADNCSSWVNTYCLNITHIIQTRTCNYTNTTNPNYVYALYHLNETTGTTINDSSGNNRNGTTINNPSWVIGKLNNSIQFNGINQYGNLGNIANFEKTDPVSWEMWFKTSTNSSDALIDRYTNGKGWTIFTESDGKLTISISGGAGLNIKKSTVSSYNNGAWRHLIITYSGSTISSGVLFYIDGQLVSTSTISDSLSGSIKNDSLITSIGARYGPIVYYEGYMDELIIWNKTLSQSDVTARYNSSNNGTELTFSELEQYVPDAYCSILPIYPQFSNIQTEYNNLTNSTFRIWNTSSINITWTDANTTIDKVLLEHNFTGSFLNYTLINYTGNIYNYTFNVTNWNKTICWKSYANSTTPRWNTTNQYCFTVYNTTYQPPPITPPNYYNGSADISKYLTKYCIDNYTIKANGTYQNQLVEVEYNCPNGCDSSLNICSPSELIIWLIVVGCFIAIILIVILLKKARIL